MLKRHYSRPLMRQSRSVDQVALFAQTVGQMRRKAESLLLDVLDANLIEEVDRRLQSRDSNLIDVARFKSRCVVPKPKVVLQVARVLVDPAQSHKGDLHPVKHLSSDIKRCYSVWGEHPLLRSSAQKVNVHILDVAPEHAEPLDPVHR